MIRNSTIKDFVSDYYAGKIKEHGCTPKGVDWKDEASQNLRFDVLYKLFAHDPDASVIDLGCGYGAFLQYIRSKGHRGKYIGLDICPDMLSLAKSGFASDNNALFLDKLNDGDVHDYVVSSGIFNVKEAIAETAWMDYIRDTLEWKNAHARHGFSFNSLTSYADEDRKIPRLFYANSLELFDLCKKSYSRHVSLLHDYGLYEFTIIVRKNLPSASVYP